jgi:integrase
MQPKLRDPRLYWRGNVIWAHAPNAKGRIVRRTTKCHDEAAAVAKVNEYERIAADPRHATAQATTLTGAVSALLADMLRRKRSAATLKKAAQKLGHFIRVWGEKLPLLRLHRNPQIVLDYIDQRQHEGASDHTIKMELQHLGMLLRIAIHLGTFPGTVAEVLPPYFASGHKPRSRWLTVDEAAALVRHLERHRAAHVMYIIATGARLSESFRARRGDTNVERRLVHIHGTKTALADDDIPITKVNARPLAWALENAPGKDKLFKSWGKLHRDLAAACVRAGIAKVTPNDLRRTFGKWHRLAGVDVTTVSKMLRHADDKLAQTTYAKISGGRRLGALAAKQTPVRTTCPGSAR